MKLSTFLKPIISESEWQDAHDRLKRQEIVDWLASAKIRDYSIAIRENEFVINVENSVRLKADYLPLDDDNMCYLPYKFGEIRGSFIIIGNGREKLRSLKNGPTDVLDNYSVAGLWLENKSLEGIPISVNGKCDLSENLLTNWEGLPTRCEELLVNGNKITSFAGISKNWSGSYLFCDQIEKGVLELLDVKDLETVGFVAKPWFAPAGGQNKTAKEIINTHLAGAKDAFDMQSDFIDAGLADWVKK
jgi:hypothetical protein